MTSWLARFREPASVADRLGPLERRVLEAVWTRLGPVSVRDLQPAFSEIAYTTLMTTLDRLYRKGVMDRTKHGRAFFYVARLTRQELESARVADALNTALSSSSADLGPLLSYFVQAVSDHDHDLLDELEALVRARRAEIDKRP
jgi:predicted transcriptional regulator